MSWQRRARPGPVEQPRQPAIAGVFQRGGVVNALLSPGVELVHGHLLLRVAGFLRFRQAVPCVPVLAIVDPVRQLEGVPRGCALSSLLSLLLYLYLTLLLYRVTVTLRVMLFLRLPIAALAPAPVASTSLRICQRFSQANGCQRASIFNAAIRRRFTPLSRMTAWPRSTGPARQCGQTNRRPPISAPSSANAINGAGRRPPSRVIQRVTCTEPWERTAHAVFAPSTALLAFMALRRRKETGQRGNRARLGRKNDVPKRWRGFVPVSACPSFTSMATAR